MTFTLEGDRPDMDILAIVQEREYLKMERDDIDEQISALNDLVRTYYGNYGEYEIGDFEVVIGRNHRFNETKAREALDADTLEEITVPKLDSKKAREILTDAEWEECLNIGESKVIIKIKEAA